MGASVKESTIYEKETSGGAASWLAVCNGNIMEDLFKYIRTQFNIGEVDIIDYSPLTLAYIGDAVYEVVIRTMIVASGNAGVNKLHKRSSNLVKAPTQAAMILAIMEHLSDQEVRLYKRGRNAKSYTIAKNASMKEYHMATGFETLMGYLYITNQGDRMMELIKMGLEKVENKI